MTFNVPQNPSPPVDPVVPGRVIQSVQRIFLPSGKVRELYKLSLTVQDANGTFRTDELVEHRPPSDCSCSPRDHHDVAECVRCGAVVCGRHSGTCQACGRVHCTACITEAEVGDAPEVKKIVRVCRGCDEEMKIERSPFLKLLRQIWG